MNLLLKILADGFDLSLVEHADVEQIGLVVGYGILFAPHVKEFLRHILGAARLLVAAHPEGHRLQNHWSAVFAHLRSDFRDCAVHFKYIVAVDLDAFHAIADRLVDEKLVAKLFAARCAQAIAVVFNEENDRQVPNRGHVDGLMEITFTRAAIPRKHAGNDVVAVQVTRERDAVGDREHGPEVGNHADHAVLGRTEVEAAVAALGEALTAALPLRKQLAEFHAAVGEDAEVAVQRQDVVLFLQGHGGAYRNGLLADAREPFADLALAQEDEHLVLDHAWQQDATVEFQQQLRIGEAACGRS